MQRMKPMRTVSQDDLARNWRNVASEAERAPVRAHVDGLPDMVILSEAEFEKFRRHIGDRLIEAMDRLGTEAKQKGLTEAKLDELLADES